jgi:3-hydroxyacyl-[acyl-carrier-protein] dehydratase
VSSPLDRYIALLPQKPPFLFLDQLEELVHGERARGAKTFESGHRVFENHLPGEPLVPGVILIEALAQLSGTVLIPPEGTSPVRGFLGSVERMRFRRLIRPDERIVLTARLDRRFGTVARFEVEASVGGEVAADGLVTVATRPSS